MTAPRRVQLEPAFLLHHRPWSDTSRILELMTRDHGRVTLFAHGSRRPASKLRGVLLPFTPILVSWAGRADGGTLTGAEIAEAVRPLPPAQLLSGFYLNELLLRLLPREDRHARLFDAYALTLAALGEQDGQQSLRRFELVLLEELGFGLELGREADSGEPLRADRYYHFHAGRGLVPSTGDAAGTGALGGQDLLGLAAGLLEEPAVLRAARQVLRAAIAHCLEGRELRSREVLLAMRRREQAE